MNSIHEYVDLMIVIDGKFRYFEDDHEISSDNSRDVVESFSNSAYCCYPNLTEIEKRNKYLEFAGDKNMDFLLVIDSDEFAVVNEVDFLFNLDKLRNSKINSGRRDGDNPDVYGVKIFEKHFEKPNFIRERYIVYSSELHGITLYNDDDLRTNHYLEKSVQYQSILLEGERAAREKIFGQKRL